MPDTPTQPYADDQGRRVVGFWRDPWHPTTSAWPDPTDAVDPSWAPPERDAVIAYLNDGEHDTPWQGYSWCRFKCGVPDSEMGAWDLTDGTYVWPEGYAHYLEKHDVKPPEEFLEHVRRQLRNR